MAQAYANKMAGYFDALSWVNSAKSLLAILFVIAAAGLSIYLQKPPYAKPASAPASEFSSERAMRHLRYIAQRPHPIGSSEQVKVRNYILNELAALKLNADVQETMAINESGGGPFIAGTVRNIVTKIKGENNTRAIALVCHYDSVPTGPGASDDGSAVAAILETLRALAQTRPLKNDLIALFTDGEEVGLLGAKTFVNEHPWAKDVGLALNFDARGRRGVSFMFETTSGNGWLIKEFGKAAPRPFANSLSYEIYKRFLTNNDTDLTVFKRAGLPGMNFAFIDDVVYYHSSIDTAERMDERSLQHQGDYMLSLVNHFGNLNLSDIRTHDNVYFNVLGPTFVSYPSAMAIPLAAIIAIIVIYVTATGFKRAQLSVSGTALGFLVIILNAVVTSVFITLLWRLILFLHRGYREIPQGDTYNSQFYRLGFVTLAISLFSFVFVLARKKASAQELFAGAILFWLILMLASAFFLPGGSYLFTWPLLFSSLALKFTLISKGATSTSVKRLMALSLCVIPAILLWVPTISQLLIALTVSRSGEVAIVVVLLLTLFIPHFEQVFALSKWALPAGGGVAGLALIVAGSLTSAFDANHPKPDHVFYALNANTNEAVWASKDERADLWTSQFFPTGATRGALHQYFPWNSGAYLNSKAPTAPLAAPDIEVLNDKTEEGLRSLRLHILSIRQASIMTIFIDSEGKSSEAFINSKSITSSNHDSSSSLGNKWGIRYYAFPKEGVELSLKLRPPLPLKIQIVDRSYELPVTSPLFKPRPSDFIPAPFSDSDSTFVSKSFSF